mmetsp:Transcript_1668/g.4216  ORF Transcript_1668/g.4216 Transcript_1668/m.4216 type:complete len:154 (+) Transcript_1668:57-518(+)
MERRGGGLSRSPMNRGLPFASKNYVMPTTNNIIRRRHPVGPTNGNAVRTLLILAVITIFIVLGIFVKLLPAKVSLISSSKSSVAACPKGQEHMWHGGHPTQDRPGSCWCGGDAYCMCTPSLAIDIVLYSKTKGGYNIWVVRRVDTGQLATIGG